MAGGLFAINRKWFFESGAYDEGMKVTSFASPHFNCSHSFTLNSIALRFQHSLHEQRQTVISIHYAHVHPDLGRRESRNVFPTLDVWWIDRDPALLPRGPPLQIGESGFAVCCLTLEFIVFCLACLHTFFTRSRA